jgi:hypothetical protein
MRVSGSHCDCGRMTGYLEMIRSILRMWDARAFSNPNRRSITGPMRIPYSSIQRFTRATRVR